MVLSNWCCRLRYGKHNSIFKPMKQYPIVCPSCSGTGKLPQQGHPDITAPITMVCPACNGTGSVICTETGNTYYGDPRLNPTIRDLQIRQDIDLTP